MSLFIIIHICTTYGSYGNSYLQLKKKTSVSHRDALCWFLLNNTNTAYAKFALLSNLEKLCFILGR